MKDKLKIGVTGASGLVGSYLCKALAENLHCEIKGLHVSGYIPPMLDSEAIEWFRGSIVDEGILQDFCNDLDIVIHTAAKVSFKKNEAEYMYQVNVDGTRELVNQLIDSKTKLIHISSIATLGRVEIGKIDETIFWDENTSHTEYAKSKFLAEMEVYRGISEGLNAMIFQPSIILGRTERELGSSSLWSQIMTFPWIAPMGKNGFVDVQDVVKYIICAINDWKKGEKIILNGTNISYKKLYEKLLDVKGKNTVVRALGPKTILLFYPLLWATFKLLGKRSEISKAAIINTSKSYCYNNEKSIELYSNQYSTMHDTLSRYA